MSKAKMLDIGSISVGIANVKDGLAFGDKLAQANRKIGEKITRNQKALNRLVADWNQYGISAARFKIGKELFEAELKGRTLASVVNGHQVRLSKALLRCISKEEEANVTAKFEGEATVKFANLQFLQDAFAEQEEKVEDAKAVAVEA